MSSKLNDDDEPITDINITPFVDIVLVLLVIFMVTANFIVNKGIPISLPQASQAQTPATAKQISFSIDKQGNYYYDKHKVLLSELSSYLHDVNPKGVVVSISADKKASYDAVVQLMDYLRAFHLNDFTFVVERSKHSS